MYDLAETLLRKGLALARSGGDVTAEARGRVNLGITLRYRGDLFRAEQEFSEALAVSKAGDERRFASYALDNLGVVATLRGQTERAVRFHDDALRLADDDGDAWGSAVALFRRGFALLGTDDPAAADSFRQSLALWPEHGDRWTLSESVEGFACIAVARQDWRTAGRLFGAAEGLRVASDVPLVPDWRSLHADRSGVAERALGEGVFRVAFRDGQGWPVERILAEIGRSAGTAANERTPVSPAQYGALSPREQEVLALVAAGMTDRDIADALFISPRTVTTHVTRIFTKLGVENRAGAAAWAVRHGLG